MTSKEKGHKRKTLANQLVVVNAKIDELCEIQRHNQSELDRSKHKKQCIEESLAQLSINFKAIEISDHAIVRYLERKYELDIEQVKSMILPDNVAEKIRTLGESCRKYPVNGFNVVIRNGVIVTVE